MVMLLEREDVPGTALYGGVIGEGKMYQEQSCIVVLLGKGRPVWRCYWGGKMNFLKALCIGAIRERKYGISGPIQ